MASYIEREAVLAKQYNASNFVNPMLAEMVVAVEDIEDIPAADVVEVVHCRDCRHLKNGCRCYCPLGSGFDGGNEYMLVDEDDFCSYGEKRE